MSFELSAPLLHSSRKGHFLHPPPPPKKRKSRKGPKTGSDSIVFNDQISYKDDQNDLFKNEIKFGGGKKNSNLK